MKKPITLLCLTFLITVAQPAFASPRRIVSLKPNITEILFALGVGDRVVGVTKYCDYPEEAKKLPKVADYTRPFVEPIIALKPDLVIGSKEESSRKAVLALQDMGIGVAIFPFTTLDETISSIRGIADIVGETQKGEAVIKKMEGRLKLLKERWADSNNVKVLVVVGKRPIIVAGHGTYIDEVLYMAGGRNVVPQNSVRYPRWSLENIIVSNPDVIIDMAMESEEAQAAGLRYWDNLRTVNAVRNGRIYPLSISVLRPSQRIADGVEKLAEVIHE